VLFTSDEGLTTMVRPDPTFQRVAENPLGENCYSSPAISHGEIFIRGSQHLIAIGKK